MQDDGMRGSTYGGEHLVVEGVFETAFLCPRHRRPQGGEEDDIVRALGEDVLGALLYEAGHGEHCVVRLPGRRRCWMAGLSYAGGGAEWVER